MFKINKTKSKHPPLVESGTLEGFFNRGVHSDADSPCLLNDTESNEHLFNRSLENKVFNILLLNSNIKRHWLEFGTRFFLKRCDVTFEMYTTLHQVAWNTGHVHWYSYSMQLIN